MGSLASGVSVVTVLDQDGRPAGFTCSAVCSISMHPPLLLASAHRLSTTMQLIVSQRRFVVNILSAQAQEVSQTFASPLPDKFQAMAWGPGAVTGMPVLEATVAHAECELDRAIEAGDHVLLLGRITGGTAHPEGLPLAYWRGRYSGVAALSEM